MRRRVEEAAVVGGRRRARPPRGLRLAGRGRRRPQKAQGGPAPAAGPVRIDSDAPLRARLEAASPTPASRRPPSGSSSRTSTRGRRSSPQPGLPLAPASNMKSSPRPWPWTGCAPSTPSAPPCAPRRAPGRRPRGRPLPGRERRSLLHARADVPAGARAVAQGAADRDRRSRRRRHCFEAPGRPAGWAERNFYRAFAAPVSGSPPPTRPSSCGCAPPAPASRGGEPRSLPELLRGPERGPNLHEDRLAARGRLHDGRQAGRASRGHVRCGSPEAEVMRSVEEPTLYTLAASGRSSRPRGSRCRGGSAPARRRRARRRSRERLAAPLPDRPRPEQVLRQRHGGDPPQGRRREGLGAPGTTASGARAVLEWLAERGVPTEGIRILDGSGLTEDDRLTAQALLEALVALHDDFSLAPEFTMSLPVSGVDGTLKDRVDAAPRRVRAKTGYIRDVAALSGYAEGRDRTRYAFSVLVNGSTCPTGRSPPAWTGWSRRW